MQTIRRLLAFPSIQMREGRAHNASCMGQGGINKIRHSSIRSHVIAVCLTVQPGGCQKVLCAAQRSGKADFSHQQELLSQTHANAWQGYCFWAKSNVARIHLVHFFMISGSRLLCDWVASDVDRLLCAA